MRPAYQLDAMTQWFRASADIYERSCYEINTGNKFMEVFREAQNPQTGEAPRSVQNRYDSEHK